MVSFHAISFFRHHTPVIVTNHVNDNKKINMNEESIISCSRSSSRIRCTCIEDISFKSLDPRFTSNRQVYPSTLNESCEQLLAAQDIKQQRLSDRRRSHGIGGAGNIWRPSEFIYADRTDEASKYKQYSTKRFSKESIFPGLWRRKSKTREMMRASL